MNAILGQSFYLQLTFSLRGSAADAGHGRSLQKRAMFVHLRGNHNRPACIPSSRVSLQVQRTPQQRTACFCTHTLTMSCWEVLLQDTKPHDCFSMQKSVHHTLSLSCPHIAMEARTRHRAERRKEIEELKKRKAEEKLVLR